MMIDEKMLFFFSFFGILFVARGFHLSGGSDYSPTFVLWRFNSPGFCCLGVKCGLRSRKGVFL